MKAMKRKISDSKEKDKKKRKGKKKEDQERTQTNQFESFAPASAAASDAVLRKQSKDEHRDDPVEVAKSASAEIQKGGAEKSDVSEVSRGAAQPREEEGRSEDSDDKEAKETCEEDITQKDEPVLTGEIEGNKEKTQLEVEKQEGRSEGEKKRDQTKETQADAGGAEGAPTGLEEKDECQEVLLEGVEGRASEPCVVQEDPSVEEAGEESQSVRRVQEAEKFSSNSKKKKSSKEKRGSTMEKHLEEVSSELQEGNSKQEQTTPVMDEQEQSNKKDERNPMHSSEAKATKKKKKKKKRETLQLEVGDNIPSQTEGVPSGSTPEERSARRRKASEAAIQKRREANKAKRRVGPAQSEGSVSARGRRGSEGEQRTAPGSLSRSHTSGRSLGTILSLVTMAHRFSFVMSNSSFAG